MCCNDAAPRATTIAALRREVVYQRLFLPRLDEEKQQLVTYAEYLCEPKTRCELCAVHPRRRTVPRTGKHAPRAHRAASCARVRRATSSRLLSPPHARPQRLHQTVC